MRIFIEYALLAGLTVLAFFAVQSMKLRRSVVYLGAFSLLSSFVYIFYNAPDVAIAEAVIGCTLSVILLLIALNKHRIVTIYFVPLSTKKVSDKHIAQVRSQLLNDLEQFLLEMEFEPQMVLTNLNDEELSEKSDFDLLIIQQEDQINIYGSGVNYHTKLVREYINSSKNRYSEVEFFSLSEEPDYED